MKKYFVLGNSGAFSTSTIFGFSDNSSGGSGSGSGGDSGGGSGGGSGGDSGEFNSIFEKCSKASCWFGDNADRRIMNILSPKMSEETFEKRFNESKNRGVNCFHLILANKGDGEYSGYSIYGESFSMKTLHTNSINIFKKRISYINNKNFGIVLWLVTDDSASYASSISSNYEKYLTDLNTQGILDLADMICVGLEVNEYWSASVVKSIINKTKEYFKGPVGVHTGSIEQAKTYGSLGDIYFAQISPTNDTSKIKSSVTTAKNNSGKPVNFFEFQRYPDRTGCEAALSAGAVGVGNW